MSDLSRRMTRFLSAEAPPAPVARVTTEDVFADAMRKERIEAMRAKITALESQHRSSLHRCSMGEVRREPCADLPGNTETTEHGELHRVVGYLEPHHAHGRAPIAEALRVDPELVARLALDPGLAGIDPRRMLFFDTETTGLSGGTGIVPFLIGLAWFEDESLRVEQLVLRKLGEEAPMLRRFRELVEQCSCLVTFNGKSFDWPLVRTRYVMNRVKMPAAPPHLDLLPCARRIYKPRILGSRLTHIEREVLSMFREDDIEGAQVPALYLSFLRGANGRVLAPVIEHNKHDLVALAALLGTIHGHFREVVKEDDPRDHLSYATVAARAKDPSRARLFAEAAASGGGDPLTSARAEMLAAKLARARREVELEEASLQRALEAARGLDLEPLVHLELAKLYEHRVRDPARAIEHAACTGETDEGKARRVARLARRLVS